MRIPSPMIRLLPVWFFFALCAVQGGGLHAEELTVAENPSNSFEPDSVREVEWSEKVRESSAPPLVWHIKSVSLRSRKFGKSVESVLRVEGSVKSESGLKGRIFCEDRTFSLDEGGKFEIEVPYSGSPVPLDFGWIGASGEVSHHSVVYSLKPEPGPEPETHRELDPRSFFILGSSVGSIRYSQSDSVVADYRSTVLTVKGAYHYFLAPPVWDLGVSAFMNLSTLSSNRSGDLRFIGANMRLGYVFPEVKKPWRLALYGGWYYSTMSASDLSFGYRNVSGPQLYPSLRHTFANGSALSGYFKFSPIMSRLSLLSFSNREWATGLAYLFPAWGRNFSLALDYANLRLVISGQTIQTDSLSLGLGLAL